MTRQPQDFVASHIRSVPRSGIRDFFELVSTRHDIISLGIGEPDFVTPWHIREASIYALDRGATSYTANLGTIELRRAISRYLADSLKLHYDPETEILITVGVSEALDLAVRAFVSPGDQVLYHEPCYVSYAPLITFCHGRPCAIPTTPETAFRLSRTILEQHAPPAARSLLLNFPTNPTGAALSPDDAEQIAAFAIERDLLVVTDEIYTELTYDIPRVSIAAQPGMKERTVFLGGFSKAWAMTGFRIGFACAPAPMIEAMMKIHQYSMLCAPVLSQRAAVEAIQSGLPDMVRMRESYRERRNFIVHSLNDIGLPCTLPDGAFYVFPSISRFGLSAHDFALRLLDEENVACVPGSAFGPSGEGFLRCAYATSLEDMKEAVSRIAAFVKRLKG